MKMGSPVCAAELKTVAFSRVLRVGAQARVCQRPLLGERGRGIGKEISGREVLGAVSPVKRSNRNEPFRPKDMRPATRDIPVPDLAALILPEDVRVVAVRRLEPGTAERN